MPGPVSFAVLPGAPRSRDLAHIVFENSKEVLLHLPLQAEPNDLNQEPMGINLDMSRRELGETFAKAIAAVPHAIGVNSHRGSLLTRHPGHMQWLMEEIHAYQNLFFIDSFTTHESVAMQFANEVGVSARKRDIFLDLDQEPATVAREFERMKQLANEHGSVIVIGHPYPATLALLELELPQLAGERFALVTISELLRQ